MQKTGMFLMIVLVVGVGRIAAGVDDAAPTLDEDTAQSRRDQLRIAVQKICPVSGNKLGEHGRPVKVAVGEHKEEVFLCCEGCAKRPIDPKHWATIHTSFFKAQRICPVMEHELPKNAKWTIVEGQIVYVCCPPCTKKIAAKPEIYSKKIDELYTASLQAAQERQP